MSTEASRSTAEERGEVTRRVTLVGSVVDAVFGVTKLLVGWFAQSQALIADGIHSLSDLATDALVLLAARHAHREPDDEHPYGHERIETVATVVLGASLIVIGLGIGFDAARRMLEPDLLLRPEPWALGAALASIIAKEWVYRYTIAAARRVRSSILEANAWHSRSDALSSVVVCLGIIGTIAGLEYVDAVAAIVVGWMVCRIGWKFAYRSIQELIDAGLDDEAVERIRSTIMAVPEVGSLHELRTRRMGAKALVDVHIILSDPRVSVSEGHQISELVRYRVMHALEDVSDVMVHIDPEDDELHPPSATLPMRDAFIERFSAACADVDGIGAVSQHTLHYLAGRIDVDVEVPYSASQDPTSLERALNAATQTDATIGTVRVVMISAPK